MSICDNCIHDEVCGLEDNHEEAITFCADMKPKNVLENIKSEIEEQRDIYKNYNVEDNNIDYGVRSGLSIALKIIDKHIESEET